MKTSSIFLASLFLFGAIACGSSSDPAACRERTPSVANGIFGCVTSTNDVGNTRTQALPDFTVQAFTTEPSTDPNDGQVPKRRL
jgi:hypothetical protein